MQVNSNKERGGALMVALVMIFMMSVMGISVMRESSLEKRMATNAVHKSTVLQAAESATEIALGDDQNLAAAFAGNGTKFPVQLPTAQNTNIATDAQIIFKGSGAPVGFSLGTGGGFQALRFEVRGRAQITTVQSKAQVAQGAYRTVPALNQ